LTIEQPRQDKNLLYLYEEPNETNKEGPFSYVHQESTVFLLQVLYMNPPNYQLASKRFPGRCEDVVLSLHIQILYASIGTNTCSQK
jgi:hypothetical protein